MKTILLITLIAIVLVAAFMPVAVSAQTIVCKYGTRPNGACKTPGWLSKTICPSFMFGGTFNLRHSKFKRCF